MLLAALTIGAGLAPVAVVDQNRMVALYDEVCLKAFPDDAAVDTLMADRKATPLTPDEVKTTLNDDPGRGWSLTDNDRRVFVFLELPPFHACSVRFPAGDSSVADSDYGDLASRYVVAHPGFVSRPVFEGDLGAFHLHALSQGRMLPDGGTEMLMMIDQRVTDPARRARGETGTVRRFVHQIHPRNI